MPCHLTTHTFSLLWLAKQSNTPKIEYVLHIITGMVFVAYTLPEYSDMVCFGIIHAKKWNIENLFVLSISRIIDIFGNHLIYFRQCKFYISLYLPFSTFDAALWIAVSIKGLERCTKRHWMPNKSNIFRLFGHERNAKCEWNSSDLTIPPARILGYNLHISLFFRSSFHFGFLGDMFS